MTREKWYRKDKKGTSIRFHPLGRDNVFSSKDYLPLWLHGFVFPVYWHRIVSVAKGVPLFTLTVSGSSASRREHRISYSALVKPQQFTDSYRPYFIFIAGPTGKWTVHQLLKDVMGFLLVFMLYWLKQQEQPPSTASSANCST